MTTIEEAVVMALSDLGIEKDLLAALDHGPLHAANLLEEQGYLARAVKAADRGISPDSQESQEAATVLAQRAGWARLHWAKLSERQRTVLMDAANLLAPMKRRPFLAMMQR